jgi:DNA-binding CsgD family transcriptional regulator
MTTSGWLVACPVLDLNHRKADFRYSIEVFEKCNDHFKCTLFAHRSECIKWASIGKTNEEIGAIMSVCRSTARYHVKRAGEKLGSVNRIQTVFKAAQLGYLCASKW